MYVCTYIIWIVHSNVNSKHKSQNCNRLQKYKRPFKKQQKNNRKLQFYLFITKLYKFLAKENTKEKKIFGIVISEYNKHIS